MPNIPTAGTVFSNIRAYFPDVQDVQDVFTGWILHVCFYIACLVSVGVKTNGNGVVIALISLTGAFGVWWFANNRTLFAQVRQWVWFASALSWEAIFWMWVPVVSQVIVTGLFAVYMVCLHAWGNTPKHLSVVIWTVFRAGTITISKGNSPAGAWYASQLFLLMAFAFHAFSRLKNQFKQYATPLLSAALVVVLALYSTDDTVPRDMYILLIMAPVLYLLTAAFVGLESNDVTMTEKVIGFIVVVCIAICLAWSHGTDESTGTIDSSSDNDQGSVFDNPTCDGNLYNVEQCSRTSTGAYAGLTGCCCKPTFHYVKNTKGCARLQCLNTVNINTQRLQQNQNIIDCCNNVVLPGGFNSLRAGLDMCMCGNTLKQPQLHGYVVTGSTVSCKCTEPYTGPYCVDTLS